MHKYLSTIKINRMLVNLNMLSICSYNCKNFKANYLMVNKLIETNQVVFICEHWLGQEEEHIPNNLLNSSHDIFLG